jgi:4-aminobutyrate aminotransferase-like enzyme
MNKDKSLIPIKGLESFIIKEAEGLYLTDTNNKTYLDLNGGQFCAIFGHNNKQYNDILKKYNNGLWHTNTNIISTSVSKATNAIANLASEMKPASIILSTGTEALSFAQRYARLLSSKDIIVTNDKSFLALTYSTDQSTIKTISTPINDDDINKALLEFEELVHIKRIAAFIIEPIISMGGGIFLSPDFLTRLAKICQKNEILFIFDESQIGFGRCGSWFYYQQLDFIPDMVIAAKSIGNGLPLSLVCVKSSLIDYEKPIISYSTHQNAPFAASIILAGIDYINNNNLLERNIEIGQYLLNSLEKLTSTNKLYSNARGKGLFSVIDINSDDKNIAIQLHQYGLEKGVILSITPDQKSIRFVTPYIIEKKQIDEVIMILDSFLFEHSN